MRLMTRGQARELPEGFIEEAIKREIIRECVLSRNFRKEMSYSERGYKVIDERRYEELLRGFSE